MQIAEHIYFYPFTSPLENNSNTILIDGPQKTIIDPGHKHLWTALKNKLQEDNLEVKEIKTAIYTHCHPDHMEAGQVLSADYNTKQALHLLEIDFLKGAGWDFFPMMGLDHPPKDTIYQALDEGSFDLLNKKIEIILTPGHSPGGICLYCPWEKVLISGDLIFAQGVGRTDFPGGNHNILKESIEKIQTLDIEILLPGHGPAVIGANKVQDNFKTIRQMFF